MTSRYQTWLRLQWDDRWRIFHYAILLRVVKGALLLMGAVRTRQWIERLSRRAHPGTPPPDAQEWSANVAGLVALVGRQRPIGANCLPQSLLVYWLLRRRGLEPDLKLGVRRVDALLEAHAWVELEGLELGHSAGNFTPLERGKPGSDGW